MDKFVPVTIAVSLTARCPRCHRGQVRIVLGSVGRCDACRTPFTVDELHQALIRDGAA